MTDIQLSWNVAPVSWRTTGWMRASRRARLIAFSSAVLALGGGLGSAANYYIATDGSDSNPGTFSQPFASMEKGRDTATNGDTVWVRGGTYLRTNTLNLRSGNSGVTFRNYANETPVLIGGLPLTNWATYSGSIQVTDVSTQGFGGIHFRQLFCNGARQRLARYPNYNGIGTNSYSFVVSTTNTSQFVYAADSIHTYARTNELELSIFGGENWSNSKRGVTSIAGGKINLSSSVSGLQANNRYFVQNAIEELDAAGEWYLDSTNKYVYFWPSNAISTVYAPAVTNLITITSGASNITILGFTMQYCAGQAVSVTNATGCLVAKNIIRNCGEYRIPTVTVSGGVSNGVVGNDISWCGGSGISIDGGTQSTLTPANHYADNNYIHDTGEYYKGGELGCGIYLGGVGNRVSRNEIFNSPRGAIYFYGNLLLIQSNHCYNLLLETDDGGAIYSWSTDWLSGWGTIIANNYIHDCRGYGYAAGVYRGLSSCLANGIYLDFAVHGVTVNSNIVARCSQAGIYLNGGSGNHATNNILYNNQPTLQGYTDTSSYQNDDHPSNDSYWVTYASTFQNGWASVNQAVWTFPGFSVRPDRLTGNLTCFSNTFLGNIIINSNPPAWQHTASYSHPNAAQTVLDSNVLFCVGGTYNKANFWTNGNGGVTLAQWQALGFDTHSITNDPLLNSDFSLPANSPALALGIKSISTNGIGCYSDPLRATWPLPGPGTVLARPLPPPYLTVKAQ